MNVLAPFLLTSLLLDAVRRSGRGRVLVTSSISMGGGGAALDDLQCETRWSGHRAYSLSKVRAAAAAAAAAATRAPRGAGLSLQQPFEWQLAHSPLRKDNRANAHANLEEQTSERPR